MIAGLSFLAKGLTVNGRETEYILHIAFSQESSSHSQSSIITGTGFELSLALSAACSLEKATLGT